MLYSKVRHISNIVTSFSAILILSDSNKKDFNGIYEANLSVRTPSIWYIPVNTAQWYCYCSCLLIMICFVCTSFSRFCTVHGQPYETDNGGRSKPRDSSKLQSMHWQRRNDGCRLIYITIMNLTILEYIILYILHYIRLVLLSRYCYFVAVMYFCARTLSFLASVSVHMIYIYKCHVSYYNFIYNTIWRMLFFSAASNFVCRITQMLISGKKTQLKLQK